LTLNSKTENTWEARVLSLLYNVITNEQISSNSRLKLKDSGVGSLMSTGHGDISVVVNLPPLWTLEIPTLNGEDPSEFSGDYFQNWGVIHPSLLASCAFSIYDRTIKIMGTNMDERFRGGGSVIFKLHFVRNETRIGGDKREVGWKRC
jgi:hypothetical protein